MDDLPDSSQTSIPCKRCDGEKQLPIDRVEGVPPEWCHRCEGSGEEPVWTVEEMAKADRSARELIEAIKWD